MPAFPDPPEVRRIAALEDGVARNRLITSSYHAFSAELARRLPGAANWCTFATWASRQAGVTIRHEDACEALKNRLRQSSLFGGLGEQLPAILTVGHPGLADAVAGAIDNLGPLRRAGDAVAAGNQKVYEEIGLEFSRFLTSQPADLAAIGDDAMDAFLSGLRDGDPPAGQGQLKLAFSGYRAAARAGAAKDRAERMLMANLRIGLHEQTRLQPDIGAALDSAVVDPAALAARIMERLARHQTPIRRGWHWLLPFLESPLQALARQAADQARQLVRLVVTDQLMTLDLAGTVLRLGRDLGRAFPAELQSVGSVELAALLARVDPTPDSTAGSGAADWADLPERMHFITDLFRTFQNEVALFAAPADVS